MGLTFPILHDSDYEVGGAYGARTLPISYVIDRQGIIQHRVFGARDWNGPQAKKLIRALLAPSPPSLPSKGPRWIPLIKSLSWRLLVRDFSRLFPRAYYH